MKAKRPEDEGFNAVEAALDRLPRPHGGEAVSERCPDCGALPNAADDRWVTVGETMHIHRSTAGIERRNEESRRYAEKQARTIRDDHYAERDAEFKAWIEEELRLDDESTDINDDAVHEALDRLRARVTEGKP